jgi:hypothetical protein
VILIVSLPKRPVNIDSLSRNNREHRDILPGLNQIDIACHIQKEAGQGHQTQGSAGTPKAETRCKALYGHSRLDPSKDLVLQDLNVNGLGQLKKRLRDSHGHTIRTSPKNSDTMPGEHIRNSIFNQDIRAVDRFFEDMPRIAEG